jgi:hypothetical protein
MDDHPAAELLRDWFNRGQSGCKFASRLASVTRRAPYTALALWTGAQENEFFRHSPPGLVNMADVPTGLSRASYENTWVASVDGTKVRLQEPLYSSVWLRKVAFLFG